MFTGSWCRGMPSMLLNVLVLLLSSSINASSVCKASEACQSDVHQDGLSLAQLRAQKLTLQETGDWDPPVAPGDNECQWLSHCTAVDHCPNDQACQGQIGPAWTNMKDPSSNDNYVRDCGSGTFSCFCCPPGTGATTGAVSTTITTTTITTLTTTKYARVIVPGTVWLLEAKLVMMKSYTTEKCNEAPPYMFSRTATVSNYTTGCLTKDAFETWTVTPEDPDAGFTDLYSFKIGETPEIEVTFDAWDNAVGGRCTYEENDACHVKEAHMIASGQIVVINEWLPAVLGSSSQGHELYYEYRLSQITTTTTTTITTTTVTTTTLTTTSTTVTTTTVTTTSVTTTTTTTTYIMGTCKVFGDPHILGFDKGSVYVSENAVKMHHPDQGVMNNFISGDFWLVKSSLVHIQGRYEVSASSNRKGSFMTVLAVGGPFFRNHTLVLGKKDAKVFFDDEEILSKLPSKYQNKLMKASYHEDGKLVQDPSRKAPAIDIQLPLHVKLLVNRGKNGVGVQIDMPRMSDGQDGQCGNFNGNGGDDTEELIEQRIGTTISADELLFKEPRIEA